MKSILTFRGKSLLIATVLMLGLSVQVAAVAGNATTANSE
jgi:hypothetical protein